ncbi:MAG: 2'-5' RNA ligase, partial [Thaumarchaeota archaeon]|nr:2'-5' RNA ligase [Nitrososphaerota archaeon]
MIEAPKGHPIVEDCRGLILDSENNWNIVALPFKRFYNYAEGHAAKIDWSTARIQEKVDGSLCIVYFYDNKWHVATRGMPDAGGEVNGHNFTFAELFWKIADKAGIT